MRSAAEEIRRSRGLRALVAAVVIVFAVGVAISVVGYISHDSSMQENGSTILTAGLFLVAVLSAAVARVRKDHSPNTGAGEVAPTARRSSRIMQRIGVALVLLGIILIAVGYFTGDWAPGIFGLIIAFLGILPVRFSAGYYSWLSSAERGEGGAPKWVKRFDRAMLIAGILLVPLTAYSTVDLFLTPRTSHDFWPLYTFVVVFLVCGFVWSYLVILFFLRLAFWIGDRVGRRSRAGGKEGA